MRKLIFKFLLILFIALFFGTASFAFASRTVGVVIDDATITTVVKYQLADDVRFSTLRTIQVDTNSGEVTLTGKVNTESQKVQAGLVAHEVDGVTKVNNLLSVVPEQ